LALLAQSRFLIPKVGGPAAAISIFPEEYARLRRIRLGLLEFRALVCARSVQLRKILHRDFAHYVKVLVFYSAAATGPQSSLVLP
jgi:hypothetical protein